MDKAIIKYQWESAAPGWATWENAIAEWAAFGAYRAVLRDCSEEVRKAAWTGVAELLKPFETGGKFIALSELLVVAATKTKTQPRYGLDSHTIAHSILHSRGAFNLFTPKE